MIGIEITQLYHVTELPTSRATLTRMRRTHKISHIIDTHTLKESIGERDPEEDDMLQMKKKNEKKRKKSF